MGLYRIYKILSFSAIISIDKNDIEYSSPLMGAEHYTFVALASAGLSLL